MGKSNVNNQKAQIGANYYIGSNRMMHWERVCVSVTPPSWTYPQPVIQQAAPGGKDSLGLGKQTGRTPPTNQHTVIRL